MWSRLSACLLAGRVPVSRSRAMSRIGKLPIPLPSGVEVARNNGSVVVRGPKGELQRPLPEGIDVRVQDGQVLVERPNDAQQMRALHGLTRSLVANMVKGV